MTRLIVVHGHIQLGLEATGNPDVIAIRDALECPRTEDGKHLRMKRRDDLTGTMDVARFDALLAEGWKGPKPGYAERFREAVLAGKRFNAFDEIERAS